MKKYLLSQDGNFYKANLHCHTKLSDGRCTPEEIKEIYQGLGYSVVAFTDHDLFVPHNELSDNNFLVLNGFEMEIDEWSKAPWNSRKSCHICFIALDENMEIQPMWNEGNLFGNAPKNKHLVKFDKSLPPYIRRYSGEAISEMMRIGRESGFFVTYNHPTWSRESYPQYINYNGMHALEMFNGLCLASGYEDYNPRVYDDLLSIGKRIYCIAGDDNHNGQDASSRKFDSGVAFTMIKAEKLDYKSITDALIAGNFYCSEGPTIDNLWIEDGKIHIECSEADRIICTYQVRKADIAYAEDGEPLMAASFNVDKLDGYVRLTVIDKKGRHACTNAYFLDEL